MALGRVGTPRTGCRRRPEWERQVPSICCPSRTAIRGKRALEATVQMPALARQGGDRTPGNFADMSHNALVYAIVLTSTRPMGGSL